MQPATLCPCNSGSSYASCCQPIHFDPRQAKTPEALMRSRYTAFVLGNNSHLLKTWHISTRPKSLVINDKQRWLGLKIKKAEGQEVEFVARYKVNDKGHRLHERSFFVKDQDQWYYLSGNISGSSS